MSTETDKRRSIDDELCKIFKVRDANLVSKNAMKGVVVQQYRALDRLTVELFCENPHHSVFKGNTEEQLAPYRRERLKRMAKGA